MVSTRRPSGSRSADPLVGGAEQHGERQKNPAGENDRVEPLAEDQAADDRRGEGSTKATTEAVVARTTQRPTKNNGYASAVGTAPR